MENEDAGDEENKESTAENDTCAFFAEEHRKGIDAIGPIAGDVFEILEWEGDGVGDE